MILVSLKLENFLSHKKTELSFGPDEQLLIDGKSGSGKSSLVEAVIWCFYGRGRAENRSLVRRGASKSTVSLELKDKDDYYLITRSVTQKGGRQTIKIDTKKEGKEYKPVKIEGVKAIQDFIEKDLLRSSYTLFINSVVYPQDSVETFVKQSAVRRKDLILEIANAGSFDEYRSKCNEKLKESHANSSVLVGTVEADRSFISSNAEKINTLSEKETSKTAVEKELADIDDKIKGNEEKKAADDKLVNELDFKNKEITRLELEQVECNTRISNLNLERLSLDITSGDDKITQEMIDQEKKTLELLYEDFNKYVAWQEAMNKLINERPQELAVNNRIVALNQLLISKMNQRVENCPELNKPCPIMQRNIDAEVESYSRELGDLNKRKIEYDEAYAAYEKKMEVLGIAPTYDKASLDNTKANLARMEQEYSEYKDKETRRQSNLENLKKQVDEQNKRMEKIVKGIEENKKERERLAKLVRTTELKNELSDLRFKRNEIAAKRDVLIQEIAAIIQIQTQIEEAKTRIDENNKKLIKYKQEIEGLELLKEAFSSNGLKSIIIDYIIPRLEDRINDILSKLSDFRIRLDTQKDAVSKESVIEGLFISIFNELGEEFSYDNYSGGERLKIIVAISEALAEIQKCKFRFLDELFIGLDEESTESFAEVMTALQTRFSQLFCISHLRNIKDMFDNKIIISKQNGISKI